MAQYFTDFSEYINNEQPNDWTVRVTYGFDRWQVVNERLRGTVLSNALNRYKIISWDAIDVTSPGALDNVEIVYCGEVTRDASNSVPTNAVTVDGYYGGRDHLNHVSLGYLNTDGYAIVLGGDDDIIVPSGMPFYVRFKKTTADGNTTLKVRMWPASDPEPNVWHLERDNVTILPAPLPFIGFVHSLLYFGTLTATTYFDNFGVGTNGDPAPAGPIEPPRDVEVDVGAVRVQAAGMAPEIMASRAVMVAPADARVAAATPEVSLTANVEINAVAANAEAQVEIPQIIGGISSEITAVDARFVTNAKAPEINGAVMVAGDATNAINMSIPVPEIIIGTASTIISPMAITNAAVTIPAVEASADAIVFGANLKLNTMTPAIETGVESTVFASTAVVMVNAISPDMIAAESVMAVDVGADINVATHAPIVTTTAAITINAVAAKTTATISSPEINATAIIVVTGTNIDKAVVQAVMNVPTFHGDCVISTLPMQVAIGATAPEVMVNAAGSVLSPAMAVTSQMPVPIIKASCDITVVTANINITSAIPLVTGGEFAEVVAGSAMAAVNSIVPEIFGAFVVAVDVGASVLVDGLTPMLRAAQVLDAIPADAIAESFTPFVIGRGSRRRVAMVGMTINQINMISRGNTEVLTSHGNTVEIML